MLFSNENEKQRKKLKYKTQSTKKILVETSTKRILGINSLRVIPAFADKLIEQLVKQDKAGALDGFPLTPSILPLQIVTIGQLALVAIPGEITCTAGKRLENKIKEVLKPKGIAVLVILPKFCLWEFLLIFKGKFKTAFRRFFSSKGASAHIEETYFRCWYYNPSYVIKHLQDQFTILTVEGLCTVVPPSYIEGFAEKRPGLFSFLKAKENKWKARWPWKNIGDYYIIALEKK